MVTFHVIPLFLVIASEAWNLKVCACAMILDSSLRSTDGPFRRILSVNAPVNDSLQLVDVDVSGADRAVMDARPSPPGGDRVRPSPE